MRILIVEDLKTAQNMALHAIRPFCEEVDFASSGAEALDQYNQKQYDLIFMDLGLPDMDGFTVAEAIRSYEKSVDNRVKIVALSAYASDEIKKEAFEVGIDEFLEKPLVIEQVRELVQM